MSHKIRGLFAGVFAALALALTGGCNFKRDADGTVGPTKIVVTRDMQGIPITCAITTHSSFHFHGSYMTYSVSPGVEIVHMNGLSAAIVQSENREDGKLLAFRELGLSEEACEHVQRRMFDAESDTYLTPEEKAEEKAMYGYPSDPPNAAFNDGGKDEP